jgi:hypothetical protein
VVKTFLIANLAVVSVWIGPTTPCRALPSGFSSTPASLLVLAPHHRNHHHYWHHWRWSRSPPLWYGAPAIGTHMMPLPGYGAPETGSSQAPTPPAARFQSCRRAARLMAVCKEADGPIVYEGDAICRGSRTK